MSERVDFLVVSEEEGLLGRVRAALARAGLTGDGWRVVGFEAVRAAMADGPVRLCVVEDRACPSLPLPVSLPPSVLLVMACDPANEALGVEAMAAGFADYLLKDNLTRLGPLVRRWRAARSAPDDLPPESELRYRELLRDTSDAVAFFDVLRGRRF